MTSIRTHHHPVRPLVRPVASEGIAREVMLICGILSSVLYVAMNVVTAMQYEGYSSISQVVSELSAIGAPTRQFWVVLGTVYAILVSVFGWGVWKSARGNRALRITGALLVAYGLPGIVAWPFAPMHQRAALVAGMGSLTDTMHIALSVATVVLMFLAIGFAAAAFGKRFRLYSIATIVVLLAFGGLTFAESPGISADLPTPFIGLWERINIGVFLLWVVVVATTLLRAQANVTRPLQVLP